MTVHLRRPSWQARDHFARCLAWDRQSRSWSAGGGGGGGGGGCVTLESNDTHTTCGCSPLTRYTLGSSGGGDHPPAGAGGAGGAEAEADSGGVQRSSAGDGRADGRLSAGWTFVLAVVASSLTLVVTVIVGALVVVYCKRVKVRCSTGTLP